MKNAEEPNTNEKSSAKDSVSLNPASEREPGFNFGNTVSSNCEDKRESKDETSKPYSDDPNPSMATITKNPENIQVEDRHGKLHGDPELEHERSNGGKQNRAAGDSSVIHIGPYRLLQRIGAGGMGEVWVAEQSVPVKRRVALKLIKTGVGSKEIIARFDAERQALAIMNHPNIARILDAGTTEDGQPYFVMELVSGQPLTTYCDQYKLSIDQRLKLFIDICAGVQHAHQKGIIHRDLKPGNILVDVQDGVAVPKIIDFGLAKALESTQRLTDQSLFTVVGQILGTFKYMSPEQASLNNWDIDTRADIYALGVILYELLTGTTPLDNSSIKDQTVLQVLEFIREKEPVKPSSKLSSSSEEQLSCLTGQRQTDSMRLKRILLGDLDWIVMKALEKDRTRRYESASGFAADIGRYLNSEPVVARPPSLSYRVRKFVRKNRAGVTAASLVVVALLGGMAGTTLAMFRAWTAESLAESRLEEVQREKEIAETRRLEAEQNLAYAKKGNEILGSVFADLNPEADYATVADLRNALLDNLENAANELEASTIGDPEIVAHMQMTLGESLFGLGKANSAIPLYELAAKAFEQKHGLYHRITLGSMNNLAAAHFSAGKLDTALQLWEDTLELRRSEYGTEDPDTLTSMNNLALGYLNSGQLDKAVPLWEETLPLMQTYLEPSHLNTLNCMNNLALAYGYSGQLDKAVSLLEEVLGLMRTNLGHDDPHTLKTARNLATGYYASNQLDKAIPMFEQTLEHQISRLGPEHPETLITMNNLATAYGDSGELGKSIDMLEQSLKLMKTNPGANHPNTLSNMSNLAAAYREKGELDKAISIYEQKLEIMQDNNGPTHADTLENMNILAVSYWSLGHFERSISLFEQLLLIQEQHYGREHIKTLLTVANLGVNHMDSGNVEQATPLLEEAYIGSQKHPELRWVRKKLRELYSKQSLEFEFKDLAKEDLSQARKQLEAGSLQLAAEVINIAEGFMNLSLYPKSAELLREGVQIRNAESPDAWNTFNARSMLGGALLGMALTEEDADEKSRLMAEAEPLLISGYDGMKERESSIPPEAATRIPESLDRLIEFYEHLDKSDESEKYRKLRDEYPVAEALRK